MRSRGPAADLAPAATSAFAAAEEQLGLRLPDSMKRLCCEVADGGFGPGEGLLPIAGIVSETLKARSDTATVGVQWPATLVVIQPLAPITLCLDSATAEVIAWDGKALMEIHFDEAPSDEINKVFFEGFEPAAPSLEVWLRRWIDGPSEEQVDAFEAMRDKAFADARERWIQRVEAYIVQVRAQSEQERAKLGLTGKDWEEQLRKGLMGRS